MLTRADPEDVRKFRMRFQYWADNQRVKKGLAASPETARPLYPLPPLPL